MTGHICDVPLPTRTVRVDLDELGERVRSHASEIVLYVDALIAAGLIVPTDRLRDMCAGFDALHGEWSEAIRPVELPSAVGELRQLP